MSFARSRLVIFDLDGTLVDSCKDLATAVNGMRAYFKLPPLPLETVRQYIGNGVRMLVSRALNGTGIDVDAAMRVQAPLYRQHLVDQTALYPGVQDGLVRLRAQGYLLAVATNKPAEATELILRHYRIRDLFLDVLGGGAFPVLKPDPAMILQLMGLAMAAPEDTWVVGDNYTDLEAARRAGTRSIFLTYGYGDPGQETPTVICDTFTAAIDALSKAE